MRFGDPFAWAWVLAVGGGTLALAVVFAMVLLQRRRRSGKLEVSSEALAPEPDARATGRALDARDLISCIAGVWVSYRHGSWAVPILPEAGFRGATEFAAQS